MQLNYTKTIAGALWVLAMSAIGITLGVTTVTGWIVLGSLALVPAFVIGRLWNEDRSMSESIHDVLR